MTCKFSYSFLVTCILHSWCVIHHWLQSGTKHVLLDSLEDALETPRRRGTSKVARDFKIDTELSGDMHTAFLSWNTSLTTVRNQASPLKTPWRTLWRHLGDGVLLRKLETSKLIQSFQVTCILRNLRKIYHWLQSGTRHVLWDSLEDALNPSSVRPDSTNWPEKYVVGLLSVSYRNN